MNIINLVDAKTFSFNSTVFARIYQPLVSGTEGISIYNAYDTNQTSVISGRFDEFQINGVIPTSQADAVQKLLLVTWAFNSAEGTPTSEFATTNLLALKTDKGTYQGDAQSIVDMIPDTSIFVESSTYNEDMVVINTSIQNLYDTKVDQSDFDFSIEQLNSDLTIVQENQQVTSESISNNTTIISELQQDLSDIDESEVALINDYGLALSNYVEEEILITTNQVDVVFQFGTIELTSDDSASSLLDLVNRPEIEILQARFENPTTGTSGYLYFNNNQFTDPSTGQDYLFMVSGGNSSSSSGSGSGSGSSSGSGSGSGSSSGSGSGSGSSSSNYFTDIDGNTLIYDPSLPSDRSITFNMYVVARTLVNPQTQEDLNKILVNKNAVNESRPQILTTGNGIALKDGKIVIDGELTEVTKLSYTSPALAESFITIGDEKINIAAVENNGNRAEIELNDDRVSLEAKKVLMPLTRITDILNDATKKSAIHREFLEHAFDDNETLEIHQGLIPEQTVNGITLRLGVFSKGKKVKVSLLFWGTYNQNLDGFVDFSLPSQYSATGSHNFLVSSLYGENVTKVFFFGDIIRIYLRGGKDFGALSSSTTPSGVTFYYSN